MRPVINYINRIFVVLVLVLATGFGALSAPLFQAETDSARFTVGDLDFLGYFEQSDAGGRYVATLTGHSLEFNDSILVIPETVFCNEIKYTVNCIGDNAFKYCNAIKKIKFPSTLEIINSGAFQQCSGLEELNFPDALREIQPDAFMHCVAVKKIDLSNTRVTALTEYVFFGSSGLEKIILPPVLKRIEYCALYPFLYGSPLKELHIPASVEDIHSGALAGLTNLEYFTVDENNEYYCVENGMLMNKEKTKLIQCPAYGEKVVVPEGVKEIASRAFTQPMELHWPFTIEFPKSLEKIGYAIFNWCEQIISATFNSVNPPTLSSGALDAYLNGIGIAYYPKYVPAQSLEAYKAAPEWRHFADEIFPIESEAAIGRIQDELLSNPEAMVDAYTTDGRLVSRGLRVAELRSILPTGLYIVRGNAKTAKLLIP